jgi:hypothetical protein
MRREIGSGVSSNEVQRLLWCRNSPDINAIKPIWPWLKRYITQKNLHQKIGLMQSNLE